jgi:hypothetical protein
LARITSQYGIYSIVLWVSVLFTRSQLSTEQYIATLHHLCCVLYIYDRNSIRINTFFFLHWFEEKNMLTKTDLHGSNSLIFYSSNIKEYQIKWQPTPIMSLDGFILGHQFLRCTLWYLWKTYLCSSQQLHFHEMLINSGIQLLMSYAISESHSIKHNTVTTTSVGISIHGVQLQWL